MSARSYPRTPVPTVDDDVVTKIQSGVYEELGFIIPEEPSNSDCEPTDPHPSAFDKIGMNEQLACIHGLLPKLTPRQAAAVRLLLNNESTATAAQAMGISQHGVEDLIKRATKNLHRLVPRGRCD